MYFMAYSVVLVIEKLIIICLQLCQLLGDTNYIRTMPAMVVLGNNFFALRKTVYSKAQVIYFID